MFWQVFNNIELFGTAQYEKTATDVDIVILSSPIL